VTLDRGAKSSTADLDQFDLDILDILQRDNLTSQRAIGEAINLSAPAVQRWIKKMEERFRSLALDADCRLTNVA
jgi:DNA-binding MarR family transcriptional regulator